jgi:hypothetical protein
VAVRGPLASARRTVDIASLVGWVTMQRVDREAKRLDDAEKEHQRLEAATEALRRQPDASKTPADPGSAAPPASAQASTVGRAPDPPATTDIKPVTPPRRAPPPPPLPPPPRSLMQELFGR